MKRHPTGRKDPRAACLHSVPTVVTRPAIELIRWAPGIDTNPGFVASILWSRWESNPRLPLLSLGRLQRTLAGCPMLGPPESLTTEPGRPYCRLPSPNRGHSSVTLRYRRTVLLFHSRQISPSTRLRSGIAKGSQSSSLVVVVNRQGAFTGLLAGYLTGPDSVVKDPIIKVRRRRPAYRPFTLAYGSCLAWVAVTLGCPDISRARLGSIAGPVSSAHPPGLAPGPFAGPFGGLPGTLLLNHKLALVSSIRYVTFVTPKGGLTGLTPPSDMRHTQGERPPRTTPTI